MKNKTTVEISNGDQKMKLVFMETNKGKKKLKVSYSPPLSNKTKDPEDIFKRILDIFCDIQTHNKKDK